MVRYAVITHTQGDEWVTSGQYKGGTNTEAAARSMWGALEEGLLVTGLIGGCGGRTHHTNNGLPPFHPPNWTCQGAWGQGDAIGHSSEVWL